MEGVIKTLKRDLEDHQEVENELAKRAHFCSKVVKKYREQINKLQKEIELAKRKEIEGDSSDNEE